ncbi:hypothetical protein FRB99_006828, partial [Tulasnella sp. 403]
MPPKSRLGFAPGAHEVCLDGICERIAGRHKEESSEPILAWHAERLSTEEPHLLQLRLLDDTFKWAPRVPITSLGFQYLQYTHETPESSDAPPPYIVPPGAELSNFTLHDTNFAFHYSSSGWDVNYSPLTHRGVETFHHTSSAPNSSYGNEYPEVTFEVRGTAVYIYGGSPATLQSTFDETYLHARQEVCVDSECFPLDVHQAYLNVDQTLRHSPVLIWSSVRLNPRRVTQVRLRLIDPPCTVGTVRRMTIDRVVVTEIQEAS